jgi:hypothetical protein
MKMQTGTCAFKINGCFEIAMPAPVNLLLKELTATGGARNAQRHRQLLAHAMEPSSTHLLIERR